MAGAGAGNGGIIGVCNAAQAPTAASPIVTNFDAPGTYTGRSNPAAPGMGTVMAIGGGGSGGVPGGGGGGAGGLVS